MSEGYLHSTIWGACDHAFLGEHQPEIGGDLRVNTDLCDLGNFPSLTLSLYICEMEIEIPKGLLHRV